MKKSTILAATVLAALSATAAYAKVDDGIVSKVDKNGDSITLSDGKVFTLPEGIEAESVKAGEHVRVVYSEKAGKIIVKSVTAIK